MALFIVISQVKEFKGEKKKEIKKKLKKENLKSTKGKKKKR